MSNQLEKLKKSIKKDYINNFELDLMKKSGFIPVDRRQNELWIICDQKAGNREAIEKAIKEKFIDLSPKYIPVGSDDFVLLFN